MLTPKDLFKLSRVLSHIDIAKVQGVTSRPILIVPYYVYKNTIDADILALFKLVHKYSHLVKIVLILDFLAAIRNEDRAQLETYKRIAEILKWIDQYVAGYVYYTGYGKRQLTQVLSDIDRIVDVSDGLVSHIFIDEVSYVGVNYSNTQNGQSIRYYKQLVHKINTRYRLLTIGNPGTLIHKDLADLFDLVIIHESSVDSFLANSDLILDAYYTYPELSDYSIFKKSVLLREGQNTVSLDTLKQAIWTAKEFAFNVTFIPNYTDAQAIVDGLDKTIQTICMCANMTTNDTGPIPG